MALPTAQLGQLGTMSMPYSIPTYEVGPSIWEKALGALLVNTATGAAQHGMDNVFAHDNAKEFGQAPASTWQRLLHGPTIDDRTATQRREQTFNAGESEKQRKFTASEADFNRLFEGTRDDAAARNAQILQDTRNRDELDRQTLADLNAQLRGDRAEAGANARNEADNAARLAQIDAEYKARGGLPSEQINNVIVERLRNQLGLGGQTRVNNSIEPGKASVSSAAADYLSNVVGGGTGSPSVSAATPDYGFPGKPDYYSSASDLAGLPPEIRDLVMQRQQAVRSRVEGPDTSLFPEVAAARERIRTDPINSGAFDTSSAAVLDIINMLKRASQASSSGIDSMLGINQGRNQ